jgi:hypothetical protein
VVAQFQIVAQFVVLVLEDALLVGNLELDLQLLQLLSHDFFGHGVNLALRLPPYLPIPKNESIDVPSAQPTPLLLISYGSPLAAARDIAFMP